MKAFKVLILGVAIIAIGAVFLLFRQNIFTFFQNVRMALVGSSETGLSYRNLLDFKLQSEASSSRASAENSTSSPSLMDGFNYVKAQVFSNYPFNNYSSVIIDAGSDKGLKEGMPVLAAGNVLLGKVISVGLHKSQVDTFFDPSWKSSVFIGANKIRGLLTGGPSPYLDFIPKNSTTTSGMAILNADSDFPINIMIGYVDSVESTNNDLWLSAKVRPLFDLSYLNEVFVITDFK